MTWWEWHDVTALAKLYGWRGVPKSMRMSTAEASDLAVALTRARVPLQLSAATTKVIAVAKDGGLNVEHGT